ncbi:hypothetical protein D3C81_2068030 [compost metagenome]
MHVGALIVGWAEPAKPNKATRNSCSFQEIGQQPPAVVPINRFTLGNFRTDALGQIPRPGEEALSFLAVAPIRSPGIEHLRGDFRVELHAQ